MRFKSREPHAAMRERRRDDVAKREPRFGRRARLGIVRDLDAGAVGADIDALDVFCSQVEPPLEGEPRGHYPPPDDQRDESEPPDPAPGFPRPYSEP